MCFHLHCNAYAVYRPPDSASHTLSTYTHIHTHTPFYLSSMFSYPPLPHTRNSYKIPLQRSNSGVNKMAHMHSLTHNTAPLMKAYTYTHMYASMHHISPCEHAHIHIYVCTHMHTHAALNETAGAIKPKPVRASFLQMDLRCGLYRIICQHAAGNETSHS